MEQAYKPPAGLIVATVEIPLTRGYVTRIEEADRVFTDGHNWQAAIVPNRRAVYAGTAINGKTVYMHQMLCPDWGEVDHVDGDGLNNCRSNLRDGTGWGNQANKGMQRNNTTGFKGVSRRPHGKWCAFIKANRKQLYLGTFGTPEEAADAYDRAAISLFGEYARTNAMMGRIAGASPPPAWQHNPPDERTPRTRQGERIPPTRCSNGHEYTPENTYIDPRGRRDCRECRKMRRPAENSAKRARRRKRAA